MTSIDGYTIFRDESEAQRKLLLQEELILDITEAISAELVHQGMLQKDLAEKLGKSKGYVSQLLSGRNLTLRTLSDVADALQCHVQIGLRRKQGSGQILHFPGNPWGARQDFELVDLSGVELIESSASAGGTS